MSVDKKEWRELFVAWLSVNDATYMVHGPARLRERGIFEIGRGSTTGGYFAYRGRSYGFAIYPQDGRIKEGRGLELDVDGPSRGGWFNINLSLGGIDICDPSFDPAIFFEPVKQKLDHEL